LIAALAALASDGGSANAVRLAQSRHACSAGYVDAQLSSGEKCLRVGEFCSVGNAEYHRYGFDCPATGHLTYYGGSASPPPTATSGSRTSSALAATGVGQTVLLGRRSRTGGCVKGRNPDRRCSPGAYYTGLTKAVICSPAFHTSTVRDVPDSEKHAVEVEYGMTPGSYGRTIEIDHIVSLELGGSNDIANLFPEPGSGPASYHVKDELENKTHDLVCSGAMTLRAAQQQIAANWQRLYKKVFGVAPR
jgi:hypothetical protein